MACRVVVLDAEAADAGRVDHADAAGEVVKRRRRRRVAAAAVAVAHGADPGRGVVVERVEQRRLADAALPDEHTRVAGERGADLLDALTALDAARQHRHAERAVRLQAGQELVPPVLVEQVDLVDDQHGPGAGVLHGDQVAVDEPQMQRRLLRGDDDHDHVDVGGDRAPPLRHVRVGARQQAAAGQHGSHAVTVVPPLHEHLVADGQVALLMSGEVGRQGGRDLAVVEQHSAGAGDDAGHDASVGAGRGSRRQLDVLRPCAELGRDQLEQEVVELRKAPAAGLLRPQRRPAQLGRPSRESESLAVVELGEHGVESSALLLVHLWMSPSGGVRHDRARGERDAESRSGRRCARQRRRAPGASPTTKEERDTTARRTAG